MQITDRLLGLSGTVPPTLYGADQHFRKELQEGEVITQLSDLWEKAKAHPELLLAAVRDSLHYETGLYGAIWGRAGFITNINIAAVGGILGLGATVTSLPPTFRLLLSVVLLVATVSVVLSALLSLKAVQGKNTSDVKQFPDLLQALETSNATTWKTPAMPVKDRLTEITFRTLARAAYDFSRMNRYRQQCLDKSLACARFSVIALGLSAAIAVVGLTIANWVAISAVFGVVRNSQP